MTRYPRIVAAVFDEPWAILPSKLEAIVEIVELRAAGGKLSEEEIEARLPGSKVNAVARRTGAVAVIPVFGVISHRMNLMSAMSGGTSTQMLEAQINEALNDESVKAIVLDVDSPGGSVTGVDELASAIYDARGRKPIIASVNGIAASAAYWIASAADEIVVMPSGQVGSIGVVVAHTDRSGEEAAAGVKTTLIRAGKHKLEANPYEPLSEDARAHMQQQVDAYYERFVKTVARGRETTPAAVKGGFGEGRMVLADVAVKSGMADRVETLAQVLARLNASSVVVPRGARAEDAEHPEPQAAMQIERMRREVDLARE